MSNPLRQFVDERRDAKLAKASGDAVTAIEAEFRFELWVQSAAQRATQINVASHIGPISHPDAKIAPFVAEPPAALDGYLRSGNLECPLDAFGNAAVLDTLAFVKVKLSDGRITLEHLRDGTNEVRKYFDFADDEGYELIRQQFLLMYENSKPYPITCSEIKQVYFPLPQGGYHLLSLVSSSGLMRENRLRMQEREWGDSARESRELEKSDKVFGGKVTVVTGEAADTKVTADGVGYQSFPDRSSIKLGGANAQNVSSFNAECKGVWPLFASYRPTPRAHQRLPKRDYFGSLRWDAYCREIFLKLHTIFVEPEPGNLELRDRRKQWFEELWLWASTHALGLQTLAGNWSTADDNHLPKHQKLWLDQGLRSLTNGDKGWRQEVAGDFASWAMASYRRMNWGDQDPVPLGSVEYIEFRSEVADMPFFAREWQTWER